MRLPLVALAPIAAILSVPAIADDKTAPKIDEVAAESAKTEEKAEEKKDERICRYIRTDTSSRRKTKVCMTADQWRENNQAR